MHVTVRLGDRLPTVALAQSYLVEQGASELRIDGWFGPITRAAVAAFQSSVRGQRIPASGIIDFVTWGVLMRRRPVSVVDVIDATDITVFEADYPVLNDGQSDVRVNYGMSAGARQLIETLVASYPAHSVALLRLHGHGGAGNMVVSGGTNGSHGAAWSAEHMKNPRARAGYAALAKIMRPYGSIELHGCHVAARAPGQTLLSNLADVCGVPVTASARTQVGGSAATRFEGPTTTAFPLGLSLASWARRVFAACRA